MNDTLQRLVGNTFAAYSKWIQNTFRVEIHGWEAVEVAIENDRPVVGAGLHAHTRVAAAAARHLPTPAQRQICAVIAGDERQVLLETFYNKLGFLTYAIGMGEESLRAARELMRILGDLRAGNIAYIYLAVDGPDGPANVPKPGAAFIARRLEATVVPVAIHSPQAIILRSRWDQMAFPVPFSDVYVNFGQPFQVNKEMTRLIVIDKIAESLERANAEVHKLAAR